MEDKKTGMSQNSFLYKMYEEELVRYDPGHGQTRTFTEFLHENRLEEMSGFD